jgi:hypothetical protein
MDLQQELLLLGFRDQVSASNPKTDKEIKSKP